MKVIKKITAIMLSIMMVLGMCSVVGAAETASGNYGDNNGIITINSAIDGQKYTIYRMLKLESFSGDNYSYKAEDGWSSFVNDVTTSNGINYFNVDAVNGYVEWNSAVEVNDVNKAELAKKALDYAKDTTHTIPASTKYTKTADTSGTVNYTELPLGYYLVDSSVGALCGLTTTNPKATIDEKNEAPTIEKNVYNESGDPAKSNTAYIGSRIQFEIFINVKKGAENYVLHDELENGLKLDETTTALQPTPVFLYDDIAGGMKSGEDYIYAKTDKGFEVTLTEQYLKKNKDKEPYTVHVGYYAILTENANIGPSGNKNKAWLSYGTSQETKPEETITRTYSFAVLKFYKNADGAETGLANAKFKLYTEATCSDDKIVKLKGNGSNHYIVDESSTDNILTSPENGEFVIRGLKAGTYYLKEIEAPKGYNLLAKPIEVNLSTAPNGSGQITIYQDNNKVDKIKVENKSGTILPSTGGIGTTIFYIAGALLVLISGVVLIAKKRTDSK